MDYKIIVDSCGELTDEMKKSGIYQTASLSMQIDGVTVVDDETFDQADTLRRIAASAECPRSSCPSPERYMELYRGGEKRVYVVTLSSELSGSYNSAQLGKKLYEEENGDKQIHVFNSCSASVGETLIALKVQECEEAGMSFDEVVYRRTAHVFCAGKPGYAPQERAPDRDQVHCGERAEYQAGHGIDPAGDDLPARTGERDKKSTWQDDGLYCR